jgi:hypothetical protein
MKAKVLEVTARELNVEEQQEFYTFKAYEFQTGLIMIPSETTNDWFFARRKEIEPCGNAVTEKVEETGKFTEFTAEELKESIEGSASEFGEDSIPSGHEALWS